MRKYFYIPIVLLIVFFSCRKESLDQSIEGDYKGTFIRSHPSATYMPSDVSLHLSNHAYSGISSSSNYPALCQGSYSVDGNKLTIVNSCMFTANFDWSFIFSGTYQLEIQESKLHIWKDYGNGVSDDYYLEKQ